MGLRRWDPVRERAAAWAVPAAVAGIALLAGLAGEPARLLLRYDRSDIADFELWRLASGHFVHLDGPHLLLNIAGLLLVWVLVGRAFRPLEWVLVLLVSIAVIDAAFWWLLPGLEWYVGLSGALHGLFAAGLVGNAGRRPVESGLLAAALFGKLAWEQFAGSLPGPARFVDGAVVTDAHLYGAVGGFLAGGALTVLRARRAARAGRGAGTI